jgi:hypothetical protein
MRLQNPALSVEEREHQEMYAQLLKAVGTNEGSSHVDIASETPNNIDFAQISLQPKLRHGTMLYQS